MCCLGLCSAPVVRARARGGVDARKIRVESARRRTISCPIAYMPHVPPKPRGTTESVWEDWEVADHGSILFECARTELMHLFLIVPHRGPSKGNA